MRNTLAALAALVTSLGCSQAVPTAPSLSTVNSLTGSATSGIIIAGVATLERGARSQFKAFILETNGSYGDITSQVVWSVDNLTVAVIDRDGWLTAKATGTAEILARLDKAGGRLAVTISAGTESPSPQNDPSTPTGPGPGPEPPPTNPTPSPSDPTAPACLPPPLPPNVPDPVPCPLPPPTP